ncbi:hypothetical protein C4D60_Mb09t02080 [Musa balbisiana]|uniref:Uncharacterized protein n=1 Tax=Musa balbisiana TaxID=52838 RepID=A0A4S8IDE6_MUSBA|nr:hypothetical protein C4D60_Mb09t02080 [Musa balbisiana]
MTKNQAPPLIILLIGTLMRSNGHFIGTPWLIKLITHPTIMQKVASPIPPQVQIFSRSTSFELQPV